MDNVPDNYQVVVKPSKVTVGSFVLLSILLLIAPVLIALAIFLDHPDVILKEEFITVGIGVIIFWYLFSILPLTLELIVAKRYFLFDKNGIWVCALKHKKFYPWSDIEVRQIINNRNANMHSLWRGVIFAPTYDEYKRFVNSPWKRGTRLFKPPFHIEFELNLKWWQRPRNSPCFEVNEEWFLSELAKLGVKLNESCSLFYKG